jgi:hypothetical protein
MRRGAGFLVVVLIVGAVIGSLLGEIIGQIVPSGPIHAIFSRGVSAGVSPFTVHLLVFDLTLGLLIKLNLCTVIGLVAAFIYLRR